MRSRFEEEKMAIRINRKAAGIGFILMLLVACNLPSFTNQSNNEDLNSNSGGVIQDVTGSSGADIKKDFQLNHG